MKKWNLTIVVILTLVLAFFLYQKLAPVEKVLPIKAENSVPLISEKISKKSILKKIAPKKPKKRKKTDWLAGYDKEKDSTKEVDLITAFRQFRKVKRCRFVIQSINENKDPYPVFLDFINKYTRKGNPPKELSALQKEYFEKWVDSCGDFMQSDDELYTSVHERYRKRFYQTKPKTKREKDFAQSWPYAEETRFINFKYDNLINGFDPENKKQSLAFERQIRHAKGLLGYININDDIDFSERTNNEIAMYERQLAELSGIKEGSIVVDDDYLVNLYQQYDINNKKIDDFLKQNVSSEAFMTLAPLLFSNKNEEMEFYDKRYYQSILPRVAVLFACSMDYPCDSDSKEIVIDCFKSVWFADESACGLNIQDYYLGHYFSLNQLIDVDQILNYFFENYAKN